MLWPWLGARSSVQWRCNTIMMILFCSWVCHLVFTQHKTMSVRQCWQTDLFLLNIFLKLYQISKRIWTYLPTIVSCSETMFRCLFSNQIKYDKITYIILNDWWRKVLIAIIFLLPCWWDCSLSWLIYMAHITKINPFQNLVFSFPTNWEAGQRQWTNLILWRGDNTDIFYLFIFILFCRERRVPLLCCCWLLNDIFQQILFGPSSKSSSTPKTLRQKYFD